MPKLDTALAMLGSSDVGEDVSARSIPPRRGARGGVLAAAIILATIGTPAAAQQTPQRPDQGAAISALVAAHAAVAAAAGSTDFQAESALVEASVKLMKALEDVPGKLRPRDADREAWLKAALNFLQAGLKAICKEDSACAYLEGEAGKTVIAILTAAKPQLGPAMSAAFATAALADARKLVESGQISADVAKDKGTEVLTAAITRQPALLSPVVKGVGELFDKPKQIDGDLHAAVDALLASYIKQTTTSTTRERALYVLSSQLKKLLDGDVGKSPEAAIRLDRTADKTQFDVLKKLQTQIGRLLQTGGSAPPPRILITDAWSGDMEALLRQARLKRLQSPARLFDRTARYCVSTPAFAAACNGHSRCQSPPGTFENACGFDPVPHADPAIRGSIVFYRCMQATEEQWSRLVVAGHGSVGMPSFGTQIGGLQQAVIMQGQTLTNVLACAPNPAQGAQQAAQQGD